MLAEPKPEVLIGHASPRIAPPRPLLHDLDGYREVAASIGITPMPWQDIAATYLTAKNADGLFTYAEVAIVVARQNGKTMLAKPLIMQRLLAGRRILHLAQVRQLPGMMFEEIANIIETTHPDLLTRRRGKIIWPRRARGDEAIVLNNGGSYRVVAAGTGAARGHSIDDLIIDELREMEDYSVVDSAGNTLRMAENPQTVYLSNAGTDDSVILNDLRSRADGDPSLAYLEWSADPEYDPGDRRGWLQANPAVGPDRPQVLRDLEKKYVAATLGGNMSGWETEALCRWVRSMRPALVTTDEWNACEAGKVPAVPHRTFYAVSMDPDGSRACIASAWLGPDDICYVSLVEDVRGDPISTADLGNAWRVAHRGKVAFDPMTDRELAKFFKNNKSVTGGEFANATSNFVARVKAGTIRWTDATAVGEDLAWTSRKENDETGSFQAVRANDDRPIPAALAAIRAVWLATGVRVASLRVY